MKITAVALCALALVACSKNETPAVTTTTTSTPAAPAATTTPPATMAPAATTTPTPVATTTTTVTSSADLPSECQAYLDKVSACANKTPGAGAAMKQAMEQTKASWASMGTNKAALASACKAATDAFAQQATMMKC